MKGKLSITNKLLQQIKRHGGKVEICGTVPAITNMIQVELDFETPAAAFLLGHKCGHETGKATTCKVIRMYPDTQRKTAQL